MLELGEERCPWGGRGAAEQWPPQPRFPPLFLPIKIGEREEEKRKRKGDGEEDEEEKEKKRKKETERERAERRERKGEEEAEKRKKRGEREKEKTEQTADDNSRASSRQVSFLPSLIRLLFSFHWHAERNSRSATNE